MNYIVAELNVRDDASIEIKLGKALRYGMEIPNRGPADVNKKSRFYVWKTRRTESVRLILRDCLLFSRCGTQKTIVVGRLDMIGMTRGSWMTTRSVCLGRYL